MNKIITDEKIIDNLLNRGIIINVLPEKEGFKRLLLSGKKIRIYIGFDATADTLHLSHAKNILLLEGFRKLGHEVILLFGDFTARIGDPSDQKGTRKILSKKNVSDNIKKWKKQIKNLMDFKDKENPPKILFNSKWLAKMNMEEVLNLASNITVGQMIERDMFQKRIKEGKHIFLHEFMYPVMQGYDSVAMEVDLEVGGTDQTFNMLVGRDLQKKINDQEKFVLTVPLLADASGKKIGKTEGNVIGITDKPEELYGKIMSLPDSAIVPCFEFITDLPIAKVEKIKQELKSDSVNPMEYKKQLAYQIVKQYNDADAATAAEAHFEQHYQERKRGKVAEAAKISESMSITALVNMLDKKRSNSESKRLIKQGGIRINGKKVEDITFVYEPKDGDIIEIGKHKTYRVRK